MQVILKVRNGYLNTDHGIKIGEKEDATIFRMSDASKEIDRIYHSNPMIGKISTERV